jgi:hypothetical protein
MYHVLVYYTRLDERKLLDIRKRYDPTISLVDDHLTLIFPVPDEISEAQISKHTRNVLNNWKPFDIHINGFIKSPDLWIFLTLDEGDDKVIQLYNELYTGILKTYHRPDLFIPHVGIAYAGKGNFDFFNPDDELDTAKFDTIVNELEEVHIDIWRRVDRFTLVSLNNELTVLHEINEFQLL